jgi:hypothetical protein
MGKLKKKIESENNLFPGFLKSMSSWVITEGL